MNIVLIGFMGSGKSTVAPCLSQLLQVPWVEMDDLVCQRVGVCNMHEVFALGGELRLRETEVALAKEYASQGPLVIATGGGAVLNKIILDYFKARGGKVVFLDAGFAQIVKRLQGDTTRPLFSMHNLAMAKELYRFRRPLYLGYADEVINANVRSAHTIAVGIMERISTFFRRKVPTQKTGTRPY